MSRSKSFLLVLALLLPLAAAAQPTATRAVAVTFDDLPFAAVPSEDDAALADMNGRLLHGLQAAGVPAVGFVNEARLYRNGSLHPARVALLEQWLAAGFELGNHTYSHVSLDRVPLDAFEADLLRGEVVTRPLTEGAGRPLRWFRHPFLHLGRTPEVREAFAAFLAAHGYRVAPVTINSSEWIFAAAYARARADGDNAAAERIAAAYLPYMEQASAHAERMSLDLFGRDMAQVLLLHANALNADCFPQLAAMMRARGYRFVSLDEALQDRAYRLPLGFSQHEGESWLSNWSRAAGLRPEAPPPLPGFVLQSAGPAARRGY